jgi:uncharacterized protein (DUF433 family)
MDTGQIINAIALNPAIRNNRAYILGTTVTVADVAIAKIYHGLDVDGIADCYGLTLPQVYAALAYYYDHKDVIDEEIRTQIRRAEEFKEKQTCTQTMVLRSRTQQK